MEILPFEQKYCKAVLELNKISLKNSKYIGKTVNPDWHDDLGKIKQDYLGNNGVFLLWLDDGRLVGMGGLLRIGANTANVKRIRVHPDYQRKGLSAEILRELEQRAKLLGYSKLVANTAKGNVPAEKMFMKAGFVPIDEKEFFSVPCTIFEKKLKLKANEK